METGSSLTLSDRLTDERVPANDIYGFVFTISTARWW